MYTEYSLLKLKQPGPRPCRLPDRMGQPFYNTADCHFKFHSSREILRRTSSALHVQRIHGGFAGLEEPLHAMSWNEPFIKQARADFLTESSVVSHCQVVEIDEEALNKHWLFVSNIQGFRHAGLQCTCSFEHGNFAGCRGPDGAYVFQSTAEYPQKLVEHLVPCLRFHRTQSSVLLQSGLPSCIPCHNDPQLVLNMFQMARG